MQSGVPIPSLLPPPPFPLFLSFSPLPSLLPPSPPSPFHFLKSKWLLCSLLHCSISLGKQNAPKCTM